MKVSDVLASLRARMRDDNAQFTKQGDEYLISLIYFWQNQILSEFAQNIKEIKATLNDTDEVELPFEILRVCAVFLGTQPVKLSSFEASIQKGKHAPLCCFEKSQQIFGFSRKVSGECTIYAVKKAFISDKSDEMTLSDDFINLLVLSVFLDLMKMQVSPDNTQRLDYFERSVVERERGRIRAFLNCKQSAQNFTSPFIRA